MDKMEFVFLKCPSCGLIFLKKRDYSFSYYDEHYREVEKANFSLDYFPQERGRGKKVYEIISRMKKKGKCLDIGCGPGYFLGNLKNYGDYELYGVEISETAARFAKKNFGIKVFNGTIDDARFPPEYFDTIILSHVLEHLPEPLEILLKIRSLLKDDGIFYCEVPDEFGSINGLIRTYILRKPTVGLYAGHLNYFGKSSLKNALSKSGFTLLRNLWTHSHIDIKRVLHQIFGVQMNYTGILINLGNSFINFFISFLHLGFEIRTFCKKS